MFGYVYIDKPNIRMKDFAEYKGYYCGLCKTLGKLYGQSFRFTVNYDIAFLSILAHNYRGVAPEFREERCIAHPIGKKFSVALNDEVQETVAHINAILGYYKVWDDVLDDKNPAKRAALAALKPALKKAKKVLPRLEKQTEKYYLELNRREKEGASADCLADIFGKLMVEIAFAACGKMDENLESLAYHLGRYVYLMDAADDWKKDRKSGAFNPYLIKTGDVTPTAAEIAERARFDLEACITNIRDAYDKMEITIAEGPLSNMVYLGFTKRMETVLKADSDK